MKKSGTILLLSACVLLYSLTLSPLDSAAETVKFEAEIRERLSAPIDVALLAKGQLFVLNSSGTVTVFDGENKPQLSFSILNIFEPPLVAPVNSSMALSPKGHMIFVDQNEQHIKVVSLGGEVLFGFGPKSQGSQKGHSLVDVEVDPFGFIYAADQENNLIQVFSPNGLMMKTIALSGTPYGISLDIQGNIYALLPESGVIEKFTREGKKVRDIISKRVNRDEIKNSSSLHVDPWGHIYLVQDGFQRIVKIDQDGQILISFGSEGNDRGQFSGMSAIFTDDSGRLYVADSGNGRIQIFKITGPGKKLLIPLNPPPVFLDFDSMIDTEPGVIDLFIRPGKGLFSAVQTSGLIKNSFNEDNVIGSEEGAAGKLANPASIFVSLDGKVYVADTGNDRVVIFNSDGTLFYQFGKNGTKPGQFNSPQGIMVNSKGMIYVADTLNERVQVFSHDGIYLSTIGEISEESVDRGMEGCSRIDLPKSITIDSKDNIYLLDSQKAQVQVFSENGLCRRLIGSKGTGPGQFSLPVDIAIDQNDNLYVADSADGRVHIFGPNGNFLLSFGTLGTGGGYFNQLSAIAASEGRIYAGDYLNNKIQVFRYSPDGLSGRGDRFYSTHSASPPPNLEINDVLRYHIARKNAYAAAVHELTESFGYTEEYLLRFVRVESVEILNDGKIKVTVSIPRNIPKQIIEPGS